MSQDTISLVESLPLPARLHKSNTGMWYSGTSRYQNFYAIRIRDVYMHKSYWYPVSYLTLSSCKDRLNKIQSFYIELGYQAWIESCYFRHS